MTFKNIKPQNDPVMRGLERLAAEKGWIKRAPIVKEAVEKFAATDNLEQDLIHLAKGLRGRGFVKEADALEDRLFIYRKASLAYQQAVILQEAHPNGNVKVLDAQGELGMILTDTSKQERIMEVLQRQPTGKFASEIVRAAADILDMDLKKTAQSFDGAGGAPTSYSGHGGASSVKNEMFAGNSPPVGSGDSLPASAKPTQESVATLGTPGVAKPVIEEGKANRSEHFSDKQNEINKRISEINAVTDEGRPPIEEKLTNLITAVALDSFVFTDEALLNSLNGDKKLVSLYSKYSSTNIKVINDFSNFFKHFGNFPDQNGRDKYAIEMFDSQTGSEGEVQNYMNSVIPGSATKYFAKIEDQKPTTQYESIKNNLKSVIPAAAESVITNTAPGVIAPLVEGVKYLGKQIFTGAEYSEMNHKFLAEMNAVFEQKKGAAFGKTNDASEKLQNTLKTPLAAVNTALNSLKNYKNLVPFTARTNSSAIAQFSVIKTQIDSGRVDINILAPIGACFSAAAALADIPTITNDVDDLIEKIKALPISSNDLYASTEEVGQILSQINEIGKKSETYYNSLDKNSPKYQEEKKNYSILVAMSGALQNSKDHPISELMKNLQSIDGMRVRINTFDDLKKLTNQLEEYYQKLAIAAQKLNIKKTAGPFDGPAARAENTAGGRPALKDENIKAMQKALVDLGTNTPVGERATQSELDLLKITPDGNWGKLTQQALGAAAIILGQPMIQIAAPGAADKNLEILNSAKTAKFGDELDSFPNISVWNTPGKALNDPQNPIKLYAPNITNLDNFTAWLFSTGLETPTKPQGGNAFQIQKDGISLEKLKTVLWALVQRSKLKYESYGQNSLKEKNLCIFYNEQMGKLLSDLATVESSIKATTGNNADVIIPQGSFASYSVGISGAPPIAGSHGGTQDERAARARETIEGRSGQRPADPIGQTINTFDYDTWGATKNPTKLEKSRVASMDVNRLAQWYYGRSVNNSPEARTIQAIKDATRNSASSPQEYQDYLTTLKHNHNDAGANEVERKYEYALNTTPLKGPLEILMNEFTNIYRRLDGVKQIWDDSGQHTNEEKLAKNELINEWGTILARKTEDAQTQLQIMNSKR